MRLPRDLSGRQLARLLRRYGYAVTRETGSHLRLTTQQRGEHHVTIPDHAALRIGTLAGILTDVAEHLGPRVYPVIYARRPDGARGRAQPVR